MCFFFPWIRYQCQIQKLRLHARIQISFTISVYFSVQCSVIVIDMRKLFFFHSRVSCIVHDGTMFAIWLRNEWYPFFSSPTNQNIASHHIYIIHRYSISIVHCSLLISLMFVAQNLKPILPMQMCSVSIGRTLYFFHFILYTIVLSRLYEYFVVFCKTNLCETVNWSLEKAHILNF